MPVPILIHFIMPPEPKYSDLYLVQVSLFFVQEILWRSHRSAIELYVFSQFTPSFSSLPSIIFLQKCSLLYF